MNGGKDSCFNLLHCVAQGHDPVAIANLHPPEPTELDSYMFQSIGQNQVHWISAALNLPLFTRTLTGASKCAEGTYVPTPGDEVEDLYDLLMDVKQAHPDVQGVAVGAILSNYQRVRVEHVCQRLGWTALAYLWRQDQTHLLQEMIEFQNDAILIKVAGMGLEPRHLGMHLYEMQPHLLDLNKKYGSHVCGEGGEYETFTCDSPLFKHKIIIDKSDIVMHSDDEWAPVAYMNILKVHLQEKDGVEQKQVLQDVIERIQTRYLVDQEGFEASVPVVAVDGARSCCSVPTATIHHSEPVLSMNGICSNEPLDTLYNESRVVFETIHRTLEQFKFSWDMVVAVNVYVKDMNDFLELNRVYAEYFSVNPPTRVTVECKAGCRRIQMDCVAVRSRKDVMHVQGISYWAPANIGPYSQSTRVQRHVFYAGQIGLVPATMSLPVSLSSQISVSLRNVASVLSASRCEMDRLVFCVGFVTRGEDVPGVRAAWKESSMGSCPLLVVVVSGLPRSARVEWHVGSSDSETVTDTTFEEEELAMRVATHARQCGTCGACVCTIQATRADWASLSKAVGHTIWRVLDKFGVGAEKVVQTRVFYQWDWDGGVLQQEMKRHVDLKVCDTMSFVPVESGLSFCMYWSDMSDE